MRTRTGRDYRMVLFCIALMFLADGTIAHAEGVPAWLKGDRQEGVSAADRSGYVWLVLGGAGDNTFNGTRIEAFAAFATVGGKKVMLDDLSVTVNHGGETFLFTRDDLDYVLYYTRLTFKLNGPPVTVSYSPRVYSKTGDWIKEEYSTNVGSKLSPYNLMFEKREVTELYGKKKERIVAEPVAGPVLALAWSRAGAEKARQKILKEYAGGDTARVLVRWDESAIIPTSVGNVQVSALVDYEVEKQWYYAARGSKETTKGEVGIAIDGKISKFAFKNFCENVKGRAHGESRHCNPHVRVSEWKKDSTGSFQRLHYGSEGVHVFYTPDMERVNKDGHGRSTIGVKFNQ